MADKQRTGPPSTLGDAGLARFRETGAVLWRGDDSACHTRAH